MSLRRREFSRQGARRSPAHRDARKTTIPAPVEKSEDRGLEAARYEAFGKEVPRQERVRRMSNESGDAPTIVSVGERPGGAKQTECTTSRSRYT
jgi:hypothetical protein